MVVEVVDGLGLRLAAQSDGLQAGVVYEPFEVVLYSRYSVGSVSKHSYG